MEIRLIEIRRKTMRTWSPEAFWVTDVKGSVLMHFKAESASETVSVTFKRSHDWAPS